MRRGIGLVLTGLGAFLVVVALMSAFYLPGQVVKFPVNTFTVTTLTGSNLKYFSQQDGIVLNGVDVKATTTTRGDVAASSSSTALWDMFTAVIDTTNHAPIEYLRSRVAINRRDGTLINCCGAFIGSNTKVSFAGQGPVWPIGTQAKNYQVFDTTLLKPVTFVYAGTTTVNGLSVYKFVEHVNNQQFGTQTVPGSLVGEPSQPTVSAQEVMTAVNTYFVDPVTGAPVNVIESSTQTLNVGGVPKLTLYSGTLSETKASIASSVHTSQHYGSLIQLVEVIIPLIAGLVGLLLLVFGILLVRSAREREEPLYDEEPIEAPALSSGGSIARV